MILKWEGHSSSENLIFVSPTHIFCLLSRLFHQKLVFFSKYVKYWLNMFVFLLKVHSKQYNRQFQFIQYDMCNNNNNSNKIHATTPMLLHISYWINWNCLSYWFQCNSYTVESRYKRIWIYTRYISLIKRLRWLP